MGNYDCLREFTTKSSFWHPAPTKREPKKPRPPRSIAGLLLTGGRNPAPQVLAVAQRANIPVLLVGVDTFAASERLEKAGAALSIKDEDKLRRFTELMNRDGALDSLIESLGFSAM